MSGKTWTEEMKRRASERMIGSKLSAAHRAAIANGQLGNKRAPEVGAKIRAIHLSRIGTIEERFKKLLVRTANGCLVYIGRYDEDGYGIVPGKKPPERGAHRYAYYLEHGPIAEGVVIRHSCDNRPCCEPLHLLSGTHADNVQDRVARGRTARMFGVANHMYGHGERVLSRRRDQDGKFI